MYLPGLAYRSWVTDVPYQRLVNVKKKLKRKKNATHHPTGCSKKYGVEFPLMGGITQFKVRSFYKGKLLIVTLLISFRGIFPYFIVSNSVGEKIGKIFRKKMHFLN